MRMRLLLFGVFLVYYYNTLVPTFGHREPYFMVNHEEGYLFLHVSSPTILDGGIFYPSANLEYIVVRMTTTTAAVVLELNGLYCPESMSLNFGHFWTTSLNAISVGIAMFTLFTFYLAVRNDLVSGARDIGSSAHPVAQFLSINTDTWTAGEVSTAVQSFLVCLEMAAASVIHNWAFSWKDFDNATDPNHGESLEASVMSVITTEHSLTSSPFSIEDLPETNSPPTSLEYDDSDTPALLSASALREPRNPTPFWPSFRDSFNWFDLYYDFVFVIKFVLGRAWSIAKRIFSFICMCGMCQNDNRTRLPDNNDDSIISSTNSSSENLLVLTA
ncbi:hypothetical protein HK096_004390 [Nowakowskiella sp. JEL0078]|nr:hypothetical protein HK096_004390 [Nowakowskiella sp. JEL0078]